MTAAFFVAGVPAPQGSKRGFVVGQRAVVVEGGSKVGREKVATWRQDVIEACRAIETPDPRPLSVTITFWLPRPKSAPKKRVWPSVKPDLDKLVRSTLDALKVGGAYVDDAQVCHLKVIKSYAFDGRTGAQIMIGGLE